MCILHWIIDIYKGREWKSTSRSVRSNKIAYHEKLDWRWICLRSEEMSLPVTKWLLTNTNGSEASNRSIRNSVNAFSVCFWNLFPMRRHFYRTKHLTTEFNTDRIRENDGKSLRCSLFYFLGLVVQGFNSLATICYNGKYFLDVCWRIILT